MASSSKLSHAASASNTGAPAALPLDALFEVLLRVPAKDLCRLRAVCRSWCALTSDPHFAAEHKFRHAEPLFAFTFRYGGAPGIAIVGLSGLPLRRIPFSSDPVELQLIHLDRLCANTRWAPCFYWRLQGTPRHPDRSQPLICDIVTLDGSSQGRWRRKQNPPSGLMRIEGGEIKERLTFDEVVYFLLDYAVMEPASTAPFNLDTEKWMPTLRGSESLRSIDFWDFKRNISLANLNGSLVIIDNDVGVSFDLWFLMDHNRDLWVKKYRLSVVQDCFYAHPLLILDDGRIVIYDRRERLLQYYDPATDSLIDMLNIKEMRLGETQSIGVYTGSLLI